MEPKYSIIIPIHNRASFAPHIVRTLNDQTFQDFHVIVYDDGSSDETFYHLTECFSENALFSYSLLQGVNKGAGGARNVCLREVESDWILFLDSDDFWDPRRIEIIDNMLPRLSHYKFISTLEYNSQGGFRIKDDYFLSAIMGDRDFLTLLKGNFLSTSAIIIHSDIINDGLWFDESLPNCQDYDLWLRIIKKYPVAFIPLWLGEYKRSDNMISNRHYRRRVVSILRVLARNFGYSPISSLVVFVRLFKAAFSVQWFR